MTDRRLQVFHAVGRLLSFTKAAESLDMTQPAVTFQIRQLEEQLNVRLFDRSHNRIDLTEAGKQVFQYAERIFSLYTEMENAVREVSGSVSGLLRIGASVIAAQYILPKLLSDFQSQYPQVRIQLKVSAAVGVISQVENSLVDIGVIELSSTDNKFSTTPFCQEELVFVAPAATAIASNNQTTISPAVAFAQQPWILGEAGNMGRELIFEFFAAQGLNPSQLKVAMELGSPEAIIGAIEVGRGVSILPRTSVEKILKSGAIQALRFSPPLLCNIGFIYKEQRFPLHVVEKLIHFATKEVSSASNKIDTPIPDKVK